MPEPYHIQYLKRSQIDRVLWDRCIDNASNGLIYGYCDYLDAMATDWEGMVVNNYEAVFPLPWRKKWGLSYLYQPFLTAQLGLFGNDINAELLKAVLDRIPSVFRFWEFSLNHQNLFAIPGYELAQRRNFVLDLLPSYEELYAQYRENAKRNIKKSKQLGCAVQTNITLPSIIELVKQFTPAADEEGLKRFEKLYSDLEQRGKAKTYGMVSSSNELLASAVFLFSHNRAYYILVGNHPNGRTLGASHALIDAFVRDHAGHPLLLDFEGSDLRNLAYFYSGFGAKEELYAAVKRNHLPWYVKWLKK